MKNQKIGHFGHLEEGLGQGHEEVVGEVKVLQLGQVREYHWIKVDQVVGTGGREVMCLCMFGSLSYLIFRWVSCLLLTISSGGNETSPVLAKERMTRLGSLANTSPNSTCSTWLPSSWRWVREGRRGGKAAARSFTSWFRSRPRELRCGAAQKAQGLMFESWLSPRSSRFNLRRFRRVGREVSSLPWRMILQTAS